MCYRDANLAAWFQPSSSLPVSTSMFAREKAFALINQLEYLDHQKPREILVGAGLTAASETTLSAINRLNTCKGRFKTAILALK